MSLANLTRRLQALKAGSGYTYNPTKNAYRDLDTGRYVNPATVRNWARQAVDYGRESVEELGHMLARGELSVADWQTLMREQIREEYIVQYTLGRGGPGMLDAHDYGVIGRDLRDQYQYLDNFAADVAAGNLSEAQLVARSDLYMNAASEAYSQASTTAAGVPELPAHPGDGTTQCHCITTPEVPVLTRRGWVPMLDVQVGDEVWTHRERWRKVTALVVKPSLPNTQEAILIGPDGVRVGCTTEHLWYGPDGWRNSIDIYNSHYLVYNITIIQEVRNETVLQDMRYAFREPEQNGPVSIVSPGMCLRTTQGLSGAGMFDLCPEEVRRENTQTVARETGHDSRWNTKGRFKSPQQVIRSWFSALAREIGWSFPQLLLGRRWAQAYDLSLSMELDHGQRSHSSRSRYSPQEWRPRRRLSNEPGITTKKEAFSSTWRKSTREEPADHARVDLLDVWKTVQETPNYRTTYPQVLFTGLLPQGTAIFDLTVEEDHSFSIGGLVAHNTSCKCEWVIEEGDDGWLCYWTLGEAEHCDDCVQRSQDWNPLVVPYAETKTLRALKARLAALKGGPTSGNFGHEGIPGQVGGSQPGGGHGAIGISRDAPNKREAVEKHRQEIEEQTGSIVTNQAGSTLDKATLFLSEANRLDQARTQVLTQLRELRNQRDLLIAAHPTNYLELKEYRKLGREIKKTEKEFQTAIDEIDKHKLDILQAEQPSSVYLVTDDYTQKLTTEMNRGATMFSQLVSADIWGEPSQVAVEFKATGRAAAVDNDLILLLRNSTKDVVAHELGHVLEFRNPSVLAACQEFLQQRTQGETAIKLSQLENNNAYGDWEVTCPDNFMHPYSGKIHPEGYTEILSMGFTHLVQDPIQFAQRDPEYFNFVINVIQGRKP